MSIGTAPQCCSAPANGLPGRGQLPRRDRYGLMPAAMAPVPAPSVGVGHPQPDHNPHPGQGHASREVAPGPGHARHPHHPRHEATGRSSRRRLRHQHTPVNRAGRPPTRLRTRRPPGRDCPPVHAKLHAPDRNTEPSAVGPSLPTDTPHPQWQHSPPTWDRSLHHSRLAERLTRGLRSRFATLRVRPVGKAVERPTRASASAEQGWWDGILPAPWFRVAIAAGPPATASSAAQTFHQRYIRPLPGVAGVRHRSGHGRDHDRCEPHQGSATRSSAFRPYIRIWLTWDRKLSPRRIP
ncbi:hypothetical protein BX264_5423 [Streptomyces sp. 2333.5]|nr:hypothetical protein BX264_5423 [Streptomyces sp. 2333.5]SEE65838.1 hypothetical protein SAMN05428943_5553 [Streptomyces sp. 2314.4]SEE91965.1 hypothetical protein SAMN05428942_5523 [Streptomyces sp. 2112.2]